MPTIPAMPAPALDDPVSSTLIYQSLYAPANPPTTPEILHGGLDFDNLDLALTKLRMSHVQAGAMVAGFWLPCTDYHWLYARRFSKDTNLGEFEQQNCTIAGLCATFFLPWTAAAVFFWWHGFFRQDATEWDTDFDSGGPYEEYWNHRVWTDGIEYTPHYGRMPAARQSIGMPDGTGPDGYVDPGDAAENRWRDVTKIGMRTSIDFCKRGEHSIVLTSFPNVYETDPKIAKLAVPRAAIGVLAFRGTGG